MGVFTQSVGVERDGHGMPRYLVWEGRRYVVAAEPVRWYERRKWWVEERRVERGRGAGLIDHEIWRLQVRLAAARRAPLLTLDIAHHRDSGRWRLVRAHDGTGASASLQRSA
ncbi:MULTISPECIES: DUF6504 family protein [Citricoccus]|uniref:DUF6504 family protein n=1 Tax=Citricoccus TaxID=169133 RepID=UPI00031D0478|nr:DUF6504 family protein [Citricoccus sp. CH26A]